MKRRQLLGFALITSMALGFGLADSKIPGRLKNAFAALEVFNYFEAKELFEKSIDKHPVGAGYGLSIIYARNDNPFFQIDSARQYIYLADSLWPSLSAKTREDYTEIPLDSVLIQKQKQSVDSIAYFMTEELAALESWNQYIERHRTPEFLYRAIGERNALAFAQAFDAGTSEAMMVFINTYPRSMEYEDAVDIYNELIYDEITAGGGINEYLTYLEQYPEGAYRREAENEIFVLFTKDDTPEVYLQYINSFPEGPFLERAWRRIYTKEIGDQSARAIANFSLQYPEYPFMADLMKNFDLATTRFYPISRNALWGHIDENGLERISPQFDWNEPFSEGLALVSKNDKIAFIDKTGKAITDYIFDEAFSFHHGFATVEIDGLYGLVDRMGQFTIPAKYDECGEMSEGFVYAAKGEKYGYLNARGEIIVDFKYNNASDFSNGLAVVEKDSLSGYIDTTGQVVIDFVYDWAEPFRGDYPARMRKNGKFGLINRQGEVLVEPVYSAIGDFSDGYFLAARENTYGFINLRGEEVIPFEFNFGQTALSESRFIGGNAKVFQKIKKDVWTAVIDTAGKKVVPAIFEDLGIFSNRLMPVKKKGKWGYADGKLNLVIPYLYDEAGSFQDTVARVSKNGLFGLIDTLGKPVIPLQFTELVLLDSILLVKDTAYGVINLKGAELVPMQFESAKVLDEYVIHFIDFFGKASYYDYRRQKFIWREDQP